MSKAKEFIDYMEEGKATNVIFLIVSWLAWITSQGAMPQDTTRVREEISQVFKMKKDDKRIDKAINKFQEES